MQNMVSLIKLNTQALLIFIIILLSVVVITFACIIGLASGRKRILCLLYGILILFFLAVSVFIAILTHVFFALATLLPALIILIYAYIYVKSGKER